MDDDSQFKRVTHFYLLMRILLGRATLTRYISDLIAI